MPRIAIAGDVGSLAWEGKRITVWENVHANGKEYSRLWTCWFSQSQAMNLQETDWVEIEGELTTKIGQYTNKAGEEKTVVEHHLNESVLKQVMSKAEQENNKAAFQGSQQQFDEVPF